LGFVRLGADAPTSDVRVGGGWYGKNTSSIQLLSSPRERSLALLDKNQKPQVALSLKEDDGPAISLRDAVGRERAVLGRTDLEGLRTGTIEQRPGSSLVLFDKDGTVFWKAP